MHRLFQGSRTAIILVVGVLAVFGLIEHLWAYEGVSDIAGVTFGGQVRYLGPVPDPKSLKVVRDNEFCGTIVSITNVHVERASGGIEGVVLTLEGITTGKPIRLNKNAVSVENRTCKFLPRINAASVGSELQIINSDPVMHNTHIRTGAKSGRTFLNVAQPAGVDAIVRKLGKTGILDVRCDAHTFMQAFIHVFEHPYFAVTDRTGRFQMTQVPPGKYELRMWHEALGTSTKTITVRPDVPLTLDLEFSPER